MYSQRTSALSGVCLAAILEYLTAELLYVSSEACLNNNKLILTPKHINIGIRSDKELSKLAANTLISKSSFAQNIQNMKSKWS